MISGVLLFMTAFAFGLGISLTAFGIVLGYRVFMQESMFGNPIIPMVTSFASLTIGLSLLFGVLLTVV